MNRSLSAAKIEAQKAVLVLGMHRSGTSAMTAGIQQALGVDLGEVRRDSVQDNIKGSYENSSMWAINNDLLDRFQTTWEGYSFSENADFLGMEFSSCRDDAQRFLEKHYRSFKIWGLKDPRVTVLLPFWEPVFRTFGSKVYRIISLRNPLEVAHSLKARREKLPDYCFLVGDDLRYSLNLWYWYNLRLLRDLPDDNNIVVGFDDLLSDPSGEMKRVGQFLGVDPDPIGLREYADGFLEKQLKHHNIRDTEIEKYKKDYGYAFELYRRMKEYAAKDILPKDSASKLLDGMPDDSLLQSWASPICGCIYSIKGKYLKGQREIKEKGRQIANRDQQLANRDRQIAERNRQIADRDRRLGEKDQLVSGKDQRIAENDRQLVVKDQEVAARDQRIEAKNQQMANRDQQLADRDQAIAEYRDELDRVYTSRSWRCTAAMRRIGAWIHGMMN